MNTRTADESLLHYQQCMGEELGLRFHLVQQELYWISSIWDVHEVLFDSPESVSLLNDRNGGIALTMQNVFLEYVILGICRLTDPAVQANGSNSTICGFPNHVDGSIRPDVRRLISAAQGAAGTPSSWRNKKIAHSDLDLKKGTASPLVGIRRIEITDAISKIFEVIKYLGFHYCQTDMVLTELGNESAVNLQFELIRAQKYRELEKEARDNGNYALYRVQTPEWIKSAHGDKRYDPARIASVEWTNDSVG